MTFKLFYTTITMHANVFWEKYGFFTERSKSIMEISLRERKKIKSRQALADAASQLFLEKGFENTTADEIAEKAELSRSTFFRYFKTKEAVVFPQQQERMERLRELIRNHEKDHTPFGAVKLGLLDMAAYFMEHRDELTVQRRIVQASPSLQYRQVDFDREWEDVIAEHLLAATRFKRADEHRARYIAGAVFGLIEAVLRGWFDEGCQGDLVKMGGDSMDILVEGIGGGEFDR